MRFTVEFVGQGLAASFPFYDVLSTLKKAQELISGRQGIVTIKDHFGHEYGPHQFDIFSDKWSRRIDPRTARAARN